MSAAGKKRNLRQTLTAAAVCRNEEADLPGFLDNLLPWVDEIVIVDDASVDRTVQISENAGGKVKLVRQAMNDDEGFAGQRNRGLAEATGDWILNMDIDERVSPQLAAEILAVIQDTPLNGFRYRRLNYFLHRPMRYGGWNGWNNPQLARRGRHRYENRIHEQCVVDGAPEMVGQLRNFMYHLNDDGYEERMRKSFQYSRLEADKVCRLNIRVAWGHILLRPCLEFLKLYVFKRGFLDGMPGLIGALHSASAVFRQYALAWDRQNRIPRTDLEEQLKQEWTGWEDAPGRSPAGRDE